MARKRTVRTLGDVVNLQRGTTYKSALLDEPGPVLLGLASIEQDGGFRSGSLRTYGGPSPEKLILRPGDIYVSLKDVTQSGDLLGAVARVPASIPAGRLTQDTVKVVPSRAVPSDYLYWVLRTPRYRNYCRAHAIGTTNLSLSRVDFLAFPIPEPSPERLSLVRTLQALEDKIDVNRRMAETLEKIARALFTSWFVDFDPVRGTATVPQDIRGLFPDLLVDSLIGLVPEGWQVAQLGDHLMNVRVQVNPKDTPEDTPYIGLEHMPRRRIALGEWGIAAGLGSGKHAFGKGDILFGKLRPYFHKVGLAPVEGICSTDILVLRPREPSWAALALMIASSEEMVARANATSTGTRMPRVSWKDLAAFPVTVPPLQVLEAFQVAVGPMLSLIVAGIHENRILGMLRDTLLPELTSGELRLMEAS